MCVFPVLRKQFFRPCKLGSESPTNRSGPLKANRKFGHELDYKLSELTQEIHRSREEISKFHPNLEEMDNSVRSSMAIDRFGRNPPNGTTSWGWESSNSSLYSENSTTTDLCSKRNKVLNNQWDDFVAKTKTKLLVTSRPNSFNNEGDFITEQRHTGILETDLDTGK